MLPAAFLLTNSPAEAASFHRLDFRKFCKDQGAVVIGGADGPWQCAWNGGRREDASPQEVCDGLYGGGYYPFQATPHVSDGWLCITNGYDYHFDTLDLLSDADVDTGLNTVQDAAATKAESWLKGMKKTGVFGKITDIKRDTLTFERGRNYVDFYFRWWVEDLLHADILGDPDCHVETMVRVGWKIAGSDVSARIYPITVLSIPDGGNCTGAKLGSVLLSMYATMKDPLYDGIDVTAKMKSSLLDYADPAGTALAGITGIEALQVYDVWLVDGVGLRGSFKYLTLH